MTSERLLMTGYGVTRRRKSPCSCSLASSSVLAAGVQPEPPTTIWYAHVHAPARTATSSRFQRGATLGHVFGSASAGFCCDQLASCAISSLTYFALPVNRYACARSSQNSWRL